MKNYAELPKAEKDRLIALAEERADYYHENFGNCAQSCLFGLREAFPDLGIDDGIFKASCGFAGGLGRTTRSACGAVSGAVMTIGLLTGREFADREGNSDTCVAATALFAERFIAKCGGLTCGEVQEAATGARYNMSDPVEKEKFAAAGGHDCCSRAIRAAAGLVARMLMDGEI